MLCTPISPIQTFKRLKKKSTKGAQGSTHTTAQSLTVPAQASTSFASVVPSQIQVDVAPINVESQPPSNLQIETPITNSSDQSENFDNLFINNSIPNSPSLFLEKPPSTTGAQLLEQLLEHQSFISDTTVELVLTKLKSIFTESTVVSTSVPISLSTSSTDISHLLIGVASSTDTLNNTYPLTVTTMPSTDIPHPLTATSMASVDHQMMDIRGTDAAAAGGIRGDAQGSLPVSIVGASTSNQVEEKGKSPIIDDPLDASSFKHPVTAYQQLAGQINARAEDILNLIHTTESMARAQATMQSVPKGMLQTTEGDDEFDADDGFAESSSDDEELPEWVNNMDFSIGDVDREIKNQYRNAMAAERVADPLQSRLLGFYRDNLKLHKLHVLQLKKEMRDMTGETQQLKGEIRQDIEDRIPMGELLRIKHRLDMEDRNARHISALETRMGKIEQNMVLVMANQDRMITMLQRVLDTQTNTQSLDDNKKGESDQVLNDEVKDKEVGEGDDSAPLRKKKNQVQFLLENTKAATSEGEQASPQRRITQSASAITPERVFKRRKMTGAETSSKNEFKSQIPKSPPSPVKPNGKNKVKGFQFYIPVPDTDKEFPKLLFNYKYKLVDGKATRKEHMAYVERNGVEICVPPSHPHFRIAKEEENQILTRQLLEEQRTFNENAEGGTEMAGVAEDDEARLMRVAMEFEAEIEEELARENEPEAAMPRKKKGKKKGKKKASRKARAGVGELIAEAQLKERKEHVIYEKLRAIEGMKQEPIEFPAEPSLPQPSKSKAKRQLFAEPKACEDSLGMFEDQRPIEIKKTKEPVNLIRVPDS
ncbi:hypothetical protein OROHE_019341 [Orobanche hederae]